MASRAGLPGAVAANLRHQALGVSQTMPFRLFLALIAVMPVAAGVAAEPPLPRQRPLTDVKFEATGQRLDRGRYLTEHLLQCFICHSERDWKQPGAPPIAARKGAGVVLRRGERRIVRRTSRRTRRPVPAPGPTTCWRARSAKASATTVADCYRAMWTLRPRSVRRGRRLRRRLPADAPAGAQRAACERGCRPKSCRRMPRTRSRSPRRSSARRPATGLRLVDTWSTWRTAPGATPRGIRREIPACWPEET